MGFEPRKPGSKISDGNHYAMLLIFLIFLTNGADLIKHNLKDCLFFGNGSKQLDKPTPYIKQDSAWTEVRKKQLIKIMTNFKKVT